VSSIYFCEISPRCIRYSVLDCQFTGNPICDYYQLLQNSTISNFNGIQSENLFNSYRSVIYLMHYLCNAEYNFTIQYYLTSDNDYKFINQIFFFLIDFITSKNWRNTIIVISRVQTGLQDRKHQWPALRTRTDSATRGGRVVILLYASYKQLSIDHRTERYVPLKRDSDLRLDSGVAWFTCQNFDAKSDPLRLPEINVA